MAATVYACAEQVRTRFSLYLTTVSSRTCSANPSAVLTFKQIVKLILDSDCFTCIITLNNKVTTFYDNLNNIKWF